jgi:hypothetical protein
MVILRATLFLKGHQSSTRVTSSITRESLVHLLFHLFISHKMIWWCAISLEEYLAYQSSKEDSFFLSLDSCVGEIRLWITSLLGFFFF